MTEPNSKPDVVVVNQSSGPNIIIRILWFIFVGWWLGQLMLLLAWVLNILIITLPLGLYILNRLPQIVTLRRTSQTFQVDTTTEGMTIAQTREIEQRPFVWRAIYFVCVGWWLSFLWMEVAWLIGVVGAITIVLAPIALPISFAMFSKSAAITTLRRM